MAVKTARAHACLCACVKYVTNLFGWYIAVWQTVFFTDYWQVTNYLNGPRITGQDYNAITIITAQHNSNSNSTDKL